MIDSYFNIHNHSSYSNALLGFPDVLCSVQNVIQKAYDLELSGVAITEHEGISSHIQALKYYEQMPRDRPFVLGLGNEIYLMEESEDLENRETHNTYPYYHFILLALDTEGHKQLRELSTRAWQRAWKQGRIFRRPTYYSDLEEIIKKNQGHVVGSTACFIKDTPVTTLTGTKKIQEIQPGDQVLTHDGTWQQVLSTTNREYRDTGCKLQFSKSTWPTICTKDHLFLLYDRKKKQIRWEEAQNIKPGEVCFAPVKKEYYSGIEYIDFSNELNDFRKHYSSYANKTIQIKTAKIKLTYELMRTFGLWLADGHIRFTKENKSVGFSFNEKDFNRYYVFVEKGMSQFGIKPCIYYIPKNHKYEINYNSIELSFWWKMLFGVKNASTKKIPNILKNISSDMNKELFYGYVLGDGHFRIRETSLGKFSTEIVTASISEQLHEDIKTICQSFGFSPSVMIAKERIDKKGVHHNLAYYLTFSLKDIGLIMNKTTILSHSELVEVIDKYAFSSPSYFVFQNKIWLRQKVKNNTLFPLNEKVFCLNVENNRSFVCNGVIVHNCLGSRLDKLLLANNIDEADLEVERLIDIFGLDNFYIECQPARDNQCDQFVVNNLLRQTADYHGVKIIPSTDTHFAQKEDAWIHKIYLQSQDGEREVDEFYQTAYLMSPNELREHLRFNFNDEQIDQMFEWSNEIRDRIKGYDLFHKPIIPQIPENKLPEFETLHLFRDWYKSYPNFAYYSSDDRPKHERYFFYQVECGLIDKVLNKGKDVEQYIKRLDEEFEQFRLISEQLETSIPCYFSSMSKIIDLIWEAGSLAMPARGSAAASLTNYLLEVTQIDPVPLGEYFPFWRFQNVERGVELPD